MVLYFIGLGLGDERDITVKGLEAVRGCARVYLEAYTAILGVDRAKLAEFYGVEISEADRDMVESHADNILDGADEVDVAFLVVGDPFAATTHSDLMIRAVERKIAVRVIHNASIMNAVASCGLQLYQFGQSVSVPYFTEQMRGDSFYDKIKVNRDRGFHTMCLLDIRVKEQSFENLMKGNKIFEPPRFMTIRESIDQLLEVEDRRGDNVYSRDTVAVGLARVGNDTQKIVSGTLEELRHVDFGGPLHTLVIPGEMHFMEKEMLDFYSWRNNRTADGQAGPDISDAVAAGVAAAAKGGEEKKTEAD